MVFKIYPPYLFQTIYAIDSFVGNHILAKNKINKTAALMNFTSFTCTFVYQSRH